MTAAPANPIVETARRARQAALALADLSLEGRNRALAAVAEAYAARREDILAANARDIAEAQALCDQGRLGAPLVKRLQLGGAKFDGVIQGLQAVVALPDPLGVVQKATELDDDLRLYRVSCPIGVICTIFESRPDALPQIASLCLKSGNAILLKGGKEASRSNRILADIFAEASIAAGAPEGWISLLETREDVAGLLGLDEYIDLIIPRGGNELVQYIMNHTKIPVTGHQDGVCHVYLHRDADPEMAIDIAVDSKCQYPAVCNATETLLVDQAFPAAALRRLAETLIARGVALKGCEATCRTLEGLSIAPATEEDWRAEYLDLVVSIRTVADVDGAIDHINRYGSHHTDAIVTADAAVADRFVRRVDSSSVMWNASTRFADGFRYGLGAEVGISTNKIHSRGPVGLEGLTIYKYIVRGAGQTVAQYSGDQARTFKHQPLDPAEAARDLKA